MQSNNDKGNGFLISLFSNTRTDGYRIPARWEFWWEFQIPINEQIWFTLLVILAKIPFKLTQSIHVEILPKIQRMQILRKLAPQLPPVYLPPWPPWGSKKFWRRFLASISAQVCRNITKNTKNADLKKTGPPSCPPPPVYLPLGPLGGQKIFCEAFGIYLSLFLKKCWQKYKKCIS